ncbi:MAG: hypothetical protein WCG12_03150 [Alcaligenaceae bacterium]
MTTKAKTKRLELSLEDAQAFAQRHGLGHLKPEYIKRLSELITPVAHFGQQVRRSPNKDDAPAT